MNKAKKNSEIINFETGTYFSPINRIIVISTSTVEDVLNKKHGTYKDDVYKKIYTKSKKFEVCVKSLTDINIL